MELDLNVNLEMYECEYDFGELLPPLSPPSPTPIPARVPIPTIFNFIGVGMSKNVSFEYIFGSDCNEV